MSSSTSHKIKKRINVNDIFITPLELSKKHIEYINYKDNDKWLDPCKNNGSYYNQFPNDNKEWCEILFNKDFFDYNGKVDIICGNPPYSCLDKWFEKSIEINPRIISYIINVNGLTTRRIEIFNKANYGIVKLKMVKVWKWYGMSYIVVFEKNKQNIIDIDRKVYR
tara:strand:- start:6786 stop:7283 length:498 start_codon:yes stop_codon:yes gene_type:complete